MKTGKEKKLELYNGLVLCLGAKVWIKRLTMSIKYILIIDHYNLYNQL